MVSRLDHRDPGGAQKVSCVDDVLSAGGDIVGCRVNYESTHLPSVESGCRNGVTGLEETRDLHRDDAVHSGNRVTDRDSDSGSFVDAPADAHPVLNILKAFIDNLCTRGPRVAVCRMVSGMDDTERKGLVSLQDKPASGG